MRRPWLNQVLARGRELLGGSRDAGGQIRILKHEARATGSSADAVTGFEPGAPAADGSDVNIGDAFPQERSLALDFDAAVLNQALPQYEILETLDRGGQGIVYRALQRSTGRVVALKVLHAEAGASGRRVQRFAREVELVARLRHPHVVTVFDSGVAAGRPYLSMELIDGLSIDDYVLVNRPTVQDCVFLFEKICRAVASVHQRGVIHRDLKPSNIRVDLEGEPHILDFGLAKCADDEPGDQSVSVAGQVVGTLPFLSPEQITGADGGVDIRTDIYALGVILHLLLTGEMPYAIEESREKVAANIVGKIPERLDRRDRERDESGASGPISSDLSHVVLKALAKEKARRYQSSDAFADDLRRYLEGGAIAARGDGLGYLVRVAWRKYRIHSMVAAAFVLLLAGSAVSMGYLWRRSDRIAREANASLEMGRYSKYGSLARDEGRLDDAIGLCKQIISIFSRISTPTVDDHRSLYSAYHDLAQVSIQRSEFAAARGYSDTALKIADSLATSNPGEPTYTRLQGLGNRLVGRVSLAAGEIDRAETAFNESIRLFKALPRIGDDMNDAPLDYEVLISQQFLAQVRLNKGDLAASLQMFEMVHEGLVAVRNVYPRSEDYLLTLVRTESFIAQVLLKGKTEIGDQKALETLVLAQQRLDSNEGVIRTRSIAAVALEDTIKKNKSLAMRRIAKRLSVAQAD